MKQPTNHLIILRQNHTEVLLNIVKKKIYLGPWIGRQTIIITTQKRSMLILSRAAKDLNGIFNNFQEDTSAFGTSGFRVSKIF